MALWISVLMAALCLSACTWVFLQPGRQPDRPGKPTSLRKMAWFWPWVDAMAHVCRPFLFWHWRAALKHRIEKAGLIHAWSPEHWVAMQLWLAIGLGLLSLLLLMQTDLATAKVVSITTVVAGLAGMWPWLWLGVRQRARQRALARELPFFLDLLTLCVEAGMSLQGALQQAVESSPSGPLAQELTEVLAQLRTGLMRADAFDALASRTGLPALRQLALTLRQADQFGMSLGPILRAQSTQQRDERFLRAEKLALQAPVKMLFPLVVCIFPCTFLIIGFPLVASFLSLA